LAYNAKNVMSALGDFQQVDLNPSLFLSSFQLNASLGKYSGWPLGCTERPDWKRLREWVETLLHHAGFFISFSARRGFCPLSR
jgi:hypothetical protein